MNRQISLYTYSYNYARCRIDYDIFTGHISVALSYENNNKLKLNRKKRQLQNLRLLHILKSNGCAICGYHKCDHALEFHHVNPNDKKFNITNALIDGESLKDELQKCILLCANCHAEIEDK